MSNLYEATFEGLEKNLKDKKVNSNEISSVITLLKKETDGMTGIERTLVIGSLNSQLEAPESNLITANGLNVAGFEKVIQEVTTVIIKEKQVTIEAEKQKEKALELEKMELLQQMEKEEIINENINVVDNFLNDMLGTDNPISNDPEFKQELAQNMYLVQKFDEIYRRKLDEGKNEELAKQETMAELGISQEFMDSEDWALAAGYVDLGNISKIAQKLKISFEEARKEYVNENAEKLSARKSAKGIDISKSSFGEIKYKLTCMSVERYEKKVKARSAGIFSVRKGRDVNIKDLLKTVRDSEDTIETLCEKKRKKEKMMFSEDTELNNEKKLFIEDITNEYVISGLPLIQIYKKYEEQLEDSGLHFYDVLDGVMESLSNNLDSNYSNSQIEDLKKYEKESKVYYSVMEHYVDIRKNLPEDEIAASIEILNSDRIERFQRQMDADNKELLIFRKQLAEKRGINLEEFTWKSVREESDRAFLEQSAYISDRKKEVKSSSQAKEKIDRITRIKEQIIKIAEEKNITQDEAAKQYFKENSEDLKDFSEKEKKILEGLGKNSEKIITNKTVIEAKKEQKNINLLKIKNLEKAISQKNAQIEAAYGDGSNPKILKKLLKEASKLNDELNGAQLENKQIDRDINPITAMDIIREKEREAVKEFAFIKYVETGKNVAEIWSELKNQDNGLDISFEETLGFIADKSSKFIKPMALKYFKLHERNTYNDTLQIQAYTAKKELVKEQSSADSKDLIDEYDRKIELHKKFIENNKFYNKGIKTALSVRTGIKPKDENESKRNISSIFPMKGIFRGTKKTNEQHEKANKNSDGIKAETLNVSGQNIQGRQEWEETFEEKTNTEPQGIIPNVKAIAKKGNVTFASIKSAFSKIVSLKKEKAIEGKESEEKNGVVQAQKANEDEITQ